MREFDVYSYEVASRSCGRISRTFSRDLSAIGMDEKAILLPDTFASFRRITSNGSVKRGFVNLASGPLQYRHRRFRQCRTPFGLAGRRESFQLPVGGYILT